MPHRVYGKEPETFAVQETLEPTDHGVNHGQEAVGDTTVPETLVNDQGLGSRSQESTATMNLWTR